MDLIAVGVLTEADKHEGGASASEPEGAEGEGTMLRGGEVYHPMDLTREKDGLPRPAKQTEPLHWLKK